MLPLLLLILCSLTGSFATKSVGQSIPTDASLLWGPYRPNLYFGVRPRIPNSLLMGLMWSNADETSHISKNLRHTCEQDEGMAGYGWMAYDVRKGGMQIVNDTGNRLDLLTYFVKLSDDDVGGSWGLRVEGIPRVDARDRSKTTTIFYLGSEDPNSRIECTENYKINHPSNVTCDGTMAGFRDFKLQIPDYHGSDSLLRWSIQSLTVPTNTIWQAKSIITKQLDSADSQEGMIANSPGAGNLHFVQQTFEGHFVFDVLFSSDSTSAAMTSTLTEGIQDALSTFNERFQSVYSPQAPFRDEQHTKFSQSLLSNLMGGIGYFYGTSKVDVSSAPEYTKAEQNFRKTIDTARPLAAVEDQGPYSLFTAVPSRPFFPRGFLWDEGFHLQVILEWDMDLALEIVSSWFDMMDENGWIAREQILGPEARSKVPFEFQTQYQHYANPPTLFLVVEAFLERHSGDLPYFGAPSRYLRHPAVGKAFLKAIYPKLKKHYEWFCRTQAGNLTNYQSPGSKLNQGYRWRGRTAEHILTSGLDDYPRAQPPQPEEMHVDALCWVGSMAVALWKISAAVGETGDEEMFWRQQAGVARSVDDVHWSEADQAYCDTTVVDGSRVEKVCHKGYISLFPFLVGLIGSHHSHLGAVLDLIHDPEELWSAHGLRSLSAKDKYYGTGEDYWRGPIWININYMVLQRLSELAQYPGPHQQKAQQIYTELRLNLVNTVFKSWKETGFAWEQYNADTGRGQRTQHFTGWTALIVKILAMPDLYSASQPQMPGYTNQPSDTRGWGMTLALMASVMVLVCWIFRRRCVRFWRGLMET